MNAYIVQERSGIMNPKLKKTTICLHISAIIYFLLATIIIGVTPTGLIFLAVFCIAMGVFVEIVINRLKQRKYWAWIAAIIICATYVPSIFIALGIIGLVGLFDESVRKDFNA